MVRVLVGIITFIIGVLIVAMTFLPPQSICDIIPRDESIVVVFMGVIVSISGILNVVRS